MPYQYLANLYDVFIEVDYQAWSTFVTELIQKQLPKAKTVLELGCGTGNLTTWLAQKYQVIGVDHSPTMLARAREKTKNLGVLFLEQDMCQLILPEKVDVCVSTCDSLNYLLEPEELVQTFEKVHHYLNNNGLFIFDLNTPYKYETMLADRAFSYTDDKAAVIWDNTFDEESQINEYFLTIFEKSLDGHYTRQEESHYQLAYNLDFIKQSLAFTGFELINLYDDYTNNQPTETTQRVVFVARRVSH